MAIRQFKPVTKGTRFRTVSDFSEITRTTPEKSLTEPLKKSGGRDNHGHHSRRPRTPPGRPLPEPLKKSGGRDNHGHISMRRIGGGEKRKYRIIDFKRNKHGGARQAPGGAGDPD